jgi:ribosome-associated protein
MSQLPKPQRTETEFLVDRIVHYIQEKKGEEIVVLDLREVTDITDFFIISSGTSNTHLKAIADEIREKIKDEVNVIPWHVEGYEVQKWILIDFVDVVVHIFTPDTREYYSLERLWDDARKMKIPTNG